MRDDPVPCLHATKWETDQGLHITWNDDRICNPCKRYLDIFTTRRALNEQAEEDEREPVI
jgi:hypothetical protein